MKRSSFVFSLCLSALLLLFAAGCTSAAHWVDVAKTQLTSSSNRLVNEGDRLASEDRQAEALLAFRHAVEKDPNNINALQKLAQAYASQGRRRLALRYIQQALQIKPQDALLIAVEQSIHLPPNSNQSLNLLWQTPIGADVPTGQALGSDQIVVALESGQVTLLQTVNGKSIWQVQLPAHLSSAPIMHGGLVWVGGSDGILYALSQTDGSTRWTFQTHAPIEAAPLVTDDQVFCAASNGTLYALSAQDGTQQWNFKVDAPLRAQPAIANGILFLGAFDGRIYALDASNGSSLWNPGILTQGAVEGLPLAAEGRVFIGANDGRVYALAPETGGQFWTYSTPDNVYAQPVLTSDKLLVASSGQLLAALNPLTGEPVWETSTPFALTQSPVVNQSTVWVTGLGSPMLSAYNLQDGQPQTQFDSGDWITSLLGQDNRLYLLGKDGTLLAYQIK